MYQWILWRHAEAGFARQDLARELTERGHQQAEDTALWLKEQGVDYPGYCSQARRGQQTLAHYCHNDAHHILPAFNPDNDLRTVDSALQLLQGQNAVIVGHLPWISRIGSLLLQQTLPAHSHSSVCWLQCRHGQWEMYKQYRF